MGVVIVFMVVALLLLHKVLFSWYNFVITYNNINDLPYTAH
jgi:vancomycin permeability regulator SanA